MNIETKNQILVQALSGVFGLIFYILVSHYSSMNALLLIGASLAFITFFWFAASRIMSFISTE